MNEIESVIEHATKLGLINRDEKPQYGCKICLEEHGIQTLYKSSETLELGHRTYCRTHAPDGAVLVILLDYQTRLKQKAYNRNRKLKK